MNVVDHVVIGGQNGNVYSMREHDPDMFTSKRSIWITFTG